jgi:septal ring-binding cell division protein DamX
LWVLVQGDYPDAQQARAAARDFPASIEQSDKLWIRRFLMLQGLIP